MYTEYFHFFKQWRSFATFGKDNGFTVALISECVCIDTHTHLHIYIHIYINWTYIRQKTYYQKTTKLLETYLNIKKS